MVIQGKAIVFFLRLRYRVGAFFKQVIQCITNDTYTLFRQV